MEPGVRAVVVLSDRISEPDWCFTPCTKGSLLPVEGVLSEGALVELC